MNHPLNNYLKIRNFGEIDKSLGCYLQRFFEIIKPKSCRLKHFNWIHWYCSCAIALAHGVMNLQKDLLTGILLFWLV